MPRPIAWGVAMLGAVASSQLPEFAQQYRQRLGGAIDELSAIVRQFDGEAATFKLDREAALQRLKDNPDPLARQRGLAVSIAADRLDRLEAQRQDLAEGGLVRRAMSLLTQSDPTVWRGTMDSFRAAVPVTAEGLWSAAIGFLTGFVLIRGPAVWWSRRRRNRRLGRA